MKDILRTALRQNAIFIPADQVEGEKKQMTPMTSTLLINLARLGFGVTEDLLYALNNTCSKEQARILSIFREIMGVNKNWTPLIKNWDIPTGESMADHILAYYANVFKWNGAGLPAGISSRRERFRWNGITVVHFVENRLSLGGSKTMARETS